MKLSYNSQVPSHIINKDVNTQNICFFPVPCYSIVINENNSFFLFTGNFFVYEIYLVSLHRINKGISHF